MGFDAQDVAALSLVATGGVMAAPKGTALPTTATGTPNGAFLKLGLISEEGLAPATEAASMSDLRDSRGEVVASVIENRSITRFEFTLLSVFDPDVAEFVFGEANVTTTAATESAGTKLAILEKGDDITPRALIFDMIYGTKRERIVVPDGQAAVTAELPRSRTALSGYTIQVTCRPDSAGVRSYRYLENDDIVVA